MSGRSYRLKIFISAQKYLGTFWKNPDGKIYWTFWECLCCPDNFGHPIKAKKVFIYAQTFWALWKNPDTRTTFGQFYNFHTARSF